jgi:hypothetical protein
MRVVLRLLAASTQQVQWQSAVTHSKERTPALSTRLITAYVEKKSETQQVAEAAAAATAAAAAAAAERRTSALRSAWCIAEYQLVEQQVHKPTEERPPCLPPPPPPLAK